MHRKPFSGGVPTPVGSPVLTDVVVNITDKIVSRDVCGFIMTTNKASTFNKCQLTLSILGRRGPDGSNKTDLMTSFPCALLAERADYAGGMGFPGGSQTALIAAGTGVVALDTRVSCHLDIGRINLQPGEELDVSLTSTSALSTEAVYLDLPDAPGPGPERLFKFQRVEVTTKPASENFSEVWMMINIGTSYDPRTAADGALLLNLNINGNDRAAQAKAFFRQTGAEGHYEIGGPVRAALIYADVEATRLERVAIGCSGADVGNVAFYTVERILNGNRAREDRSRQYGAAAQLVARVENTNPDKAAALRASYNIRTAGELERMRGI